MKLSINSTKKIKKFYLKDLNDKIHYIELDKNQKLPKGWYELNIFYVDERIKIKDISINGASLREFIYTGFTVDSTGYRHSPGSSLWEEGTCFKLWIHTEVGIMFQRFCEAIHNYDFGTNLFEKYVFTIDKPVHLEAAWGEPWVSYFKNGSGPRWWLKDDRSTPWTIAKVPEIDKNFLVKELARVLPHMEEIYPGWTSQSLKEGKSDLPFVPWEKIHSKVVTDFFKEIGFKNIINIGLQRLAPRTTVRLHRDDHVTREMYQYTKGCRKFYWNLSDTENVYFKLGRSGLLPLEHPLWINTIEHSHALVNARNSERIVVLAYGQI